MNRNIAVLSKGFLIVSALGAFAAVSLSGTPAGAQWAPPPPEFIATTEPVYYEGHAAYWYANRWNWRDEHSAWNHYDREPPPLAERRAHSPPVRRSYGHGGRR
jgi:hypothetical protein